MTKIIYLAAALFAVSGCAVAEAQSSSSGEKCIDADSKLVEQKRKVGEFDAVEVRGAADIRLRQGKHRPIVVHTHANVHDRLETVVENRTLIVKMKGCVRGASTTTLTVWSASPSRVSIKGSGTIAADALDVDSLAASVTGSGTMKLSGKATSHAISISGSGEVSAAKLRTQKTSVNIAGSGEATVRASADLDVTIAGSGEVRYAGKPAVRRSIAGSGAVERY